VSSNKFRDGRTALNNGPEKHSGRPGTSHTDENCVIVKDVIRGAQRVKVLEIAELTGLANKHCSWNHPRFKLL
jgi:hypothetical protein